MSRLGKLPITIPTGVTMSQEGQVLTVKGPKGEVRAHLPKVAKLETTDGVLKVVVADLKSSDNRAAWGLARQLVANAVQGVSQGFVKKLELSGIGFKVQLEGKDLVFNLGFSHQVRYPVPEGLTAVVEKNTQITLSGAAKDQLGQVAAEIRALKEPEPYKGKGIKYADEVVRRKAGKVMKSAGAK